MPGAMYLDRGATPRKPNGFTSPLHPRQIMALALYIASLVGWCAFVIPFIPSVGDNHQLIVSVIYFGLFCLGIWSYIRLGLDDPIHARVITRMERPLTSTFKELDFRQCGLCDIWIEPTTKHCHDCGKCVEKFDHHCHYLNTCIGQTNYTHFAILISVLTTLFAIHIGEALYLLILAGSNDSLFTYSYFGSSGGDRNRPLYMTLICVTVIPAVVGFVLTGILLGFHIWVVGIRGLTTWAWILEGRRLADLKPRKLTAADVEAEKKRNAAQLAEREQWRRDREEDLAKRAAAKKGYGSRPPPQASANSKLTMDKVAAKMKADAALAAQVSAVSAAGGAASTGEVSVVVISENGTVELNLAAKAEEERRREEARLREERARTAAAAGTNTSTFGSGYDNSTDDKTREWREFEEQQRIEARKASAAATAAVQAQSQTQAAAAAASVNSGTVSVTINDSTQTTAVSTGGGGGGGGATGTNSSANSTVHSRTGSGSGIAAGGGGSAAPITVAIASHHPVSNGHGIALNGGTASTAATATASADAAPDSHAGANGLTLSAGSPALASTSLLRTDSTGSSSSPAPHALRVDSGNFNPGPLSPTAVRLGDAVNEAPQSPQ